MKIRGAVQGVGFRPFVFRLAHELHLTGWVGNDPRGVVLEVQGTWSRLQEFLRRLDTDGPAVARVESIITSTRPVLESSGFTIHTSHETGPPRAQILPDLATCPACLAELRDVHQRRYGYPFTNCTHCGPRFTIIKSLPYDRPRTTMAGFALCTDCREEYQDPADRRFHAQPNACHRCGPRLELTDPAGSSRRLGEAAMEQAVAALGDGMVVAVKGLGGFHLMASAMHPEPLRRLREGKARREKAFALMAADLAQARMLCRVDGPAGELLASPAAPIVLLPRRLDAPVHDLVAPGRRNLGVMLAAMPLHHLLLAAHGAPLVATSGNLKDEPICSCEDDARRRLAGLAQLFLFHDRPIARHVDDSVVQIAAGRPRLIRRARGYAPRPITVKEELPSLLAVGGHQKVTVALSAGRDVFLSQHLGDMETPEAMAALQHTVADFSELYAADPVALVHDTHPDYATTIWAREEAARRGIPCLEVQHHHAHLASCLADQEHEGEALGVTWDGTGRGSDGTVWGGEFLEGDAAQVQRVAHLHPFALPGGAAAIRQPRRVALAMLWSMEGPAALARHDLRPITSFRPQALEVLGRMLDRGFNTPVTTSAGRLFDGVASLMGLRQEVHEEGIAAVELEQIADPDHHDAYPMPLENRLGPLVLDWRITVQALLDDLRRGTAPARVAARFHNALAAAIVDVAGRRGREFVALTGGCFQNVLLLERTVAGLEKAGHRVLLHRQVPCNDGGLSLGQILVAAARLQGDGQVRSELNSSTQGDGGNAPSRKRRS